MSLKGSNTTVGTSHTRTGPPPALMRRYRQMLFDVDRLANRDYQGYDGKRIADFNADQRQAFQGVRDAQGLWQPYFTQAQEFAQRGGVPAYEVVDRYMSPYIGNVVDATRANFSDTNREQQSQVLGNAVLKGAMGGDRVGVLQGELARQQRSVQDPIIAGLYNTGYQNALGTAQADQQRFGSMANIMAGLGSGAQGAAYTDTGQLYNTGAIQQRQRQAGLDVAYQDFLERRAFPYQQAQWQASILGGLGPQMGSVTNGYTTSTTPPPSPLATGLGLGLAGAGLYMGMPPYMTAAGGAALGQGGIGSARYGGRVLHRADGGGIMLPYGAQPSLGIPVNALPLARPMPAPVMPPPGGMSSATTPSAADMVGTALGLARTIRGYGAQPKPFEPYQPEYGRGGSVEYDPNSIYVPRRDIGGSVEDPLPFGAYDDAGAEAFAFAPPPPVFAPGPPMAPQSTGLGMGSFLPRGGFSPEFGQSLMAAGFGMMASKSPHPGVAIGEGGLRGVQTYTDAKESKRKAELEAEKLAEMSRRSAAALAETSRHNRATEGLSAENLQRGMYELVPGTGRDADGNPVAGTYKHNRKTGDVTFEPGMEVTRKAADPLGQAKLDMKQRELDLKYGRGNYELVPGTGPGADGNPVAGTWAHNKITGEKTFEPGVSVTSRSGAGARDPARTREAQILVDKGVAPDFETAYGMVRTGVNNVATYQRLVQAEKEALAKRIGNIQMTDDELEKKAQDNVAQRAQAAPRAPGMPGAGAPLPRVVPWENAAQPPRNGALLPSVQPNAIAKAKEAIARGAPRDAVIKRLLDAGIDPGDL